MELPVLDTSIRTETGKGPARRLRTQGLVPAVLYGRGMDPLLLSVSPKALRSALSGPLHINTVMKLNIANAAKKAKSEYTALVCDHQYDPVSKELLHVDFHTVDMQQKIQVDVPFTRKGRSIGEQAGGVLSISYRTLPVECLPAEIPSEISVDTTSLPLGGSISVSDLDLIEGVTVMLPPETTLISIITTKVEEEVKPEEAEAAEEGKKTAEAEAEKPGDKPEDKASSKS